VPRRLLPALAISLGVLAIARPAHAVDPVASFKYLVTGNGFGFSVYDQTANAIKHFLERPYRFLRANPQNPDGDGIVRRNLAFDTYFGVKVGATAGWLGGRAPSEVGYVEQSNMIRSAVTLGGVTTATYFVSPFGFAGNGLVMLLEVKNTSGTAQPVTAYAIHNFKLGSAPNPDDPSANGESINYNGTVATETGPGGGTMVYAPIGGADVASCADNVFTSVNAGAGISAQASCSGTDKKQAFQKDLGTIAPGESKWWGVALVFDADGNGSGAATAWSTFAAGRTADKLYTDVLAEVEAWRKPPPTALDATETAIWRQSEMVMRMSQILEPYQENPRRKNHGMVLASLPPGGWHTGWVRDAAYALTAMARTGHVDMAKKGLQFFLDADAGRYPEYVQNQDGYRVSTVRYYGDGQEEADYAGHPSRNIEIDGWGLFMWSARQYLDASNDVAWLSEITKKGDTVYDAIREGVAEPLAANMESAGMAMADSGIWEVHHANRQHFLYTTAAAARGFCDMATIARRMNRMEDVERYRALAEKAKAVIPTAFIDSQKVLAGSLERLAQGTNYRDGSTVEAITWDLLPGGDPVARATLDSMSYLVTPAGGYKRVEGSQDQYDTDEWILIDLRASAAFRRAGRAEKADQLLNWVTAQAAVNNDLLPELYNTRTSSGQIGAYSGSIPMVGYGAGAYQMTLLDRALQFEHSDCGEFDPGMYPDGGVGPGTGSGSGEERTGVACACQGGPGSAGNAVMFAIVGLLVVRRRRR
jgi:MYXO-CTERM domain-containing protein